MGVEDFKARSMKSTLILAAALVAVALAGSSFDEDGSVACAYTTASGVSTQAMWTSGLGSTACVEDTDDLGTYYRGSCQNGENQGTYTVAGYSDATCTPAKTDAANAVAATSLPASINPGASSNPTTVRSCGACPPAAQEDKTFVYIAGFFSVVLGYLLVVCLGMYICFKMGIPCP